MSTTITPTTGTTTPARVRCECGSIEMPVGALSVIDSPEMGRSILHTTHECEALA